MNKNKTYTVKVTINDKVTTYEKCDSEFIAELIDCPACEDEEWYMEIWNDHFDDTVNFFKGSA